MTGVDREQVHRVARLARLELSEEEVERLAEELGRVLSRFADLEAAESGEGPPRVGRGEPGTGAGGTPPNGDDPGGEPPPRPDRPGADSLARDPGSLAPEWREGFFLVPRLEALGEGDDG